MTATNPRILMEGIGAIGGVLAAHMVQAGLSPLLVTGNPEVTDAINEDGLRVTTRKKTMTIPARAFTSLTDVGAEGGFDAAYLLMKANRVVEAARQSLPLLKPEGCMVTFQNGIVEDTVADAVGGDRVLGAVVGWGAEMRAPGVYEKTSRGRTIVGELEGQLTNRVMDVSLSLKDAAPVFISPNIRGVLWSKLAINSMITCPGALTGQRVGEMLRDGRARSLCLSIYQEVIDTALALGIRLEPAATGPRLLYLARRAGPLTRSAKHIVARLMGLKYGKLKSSSLQSLERGRQTEIDYLNGYVVQKAREAGVDVPANEAVVRMVKQIEGGHRPIGPENLKELASWLKR
ncbi:MAG: ketopantoate reductase family protein [Acidobacteriota bacterium]